MESGDGKYDDKILELILTWQPFTSFLKILSKHQSQYILKDTIYHV